MTETTPLAELLKVAERDDRVLAVFLFGSRARGEPLPGADTDVCVILSARTDSPQTRLQTRLDYLGNSDLDVHVFQRLPLYVRQRVLKEGRPLLVKSEDELYDVAFRTIRSYEDFRPFYLSYLQHVANA